jgi:hypothetical protein
MNSKASRLPAALRRGVVVAGPPAQRGTTRQGSRQAGT